MQICRFKKHLGERSLKFSRAVASTSKKTEHKAQEKTGLQILIVGGTIVTEKKKDTV